MFSPALRTQALEGSDCKQAPLKHHFEDRATGPVLKPSSTGEEDGTEVVTLLLRQDFSRCHCLCFLQEQKSQQLWLNAWAGQGDRGADWCLCSLLLCSSEMFLRISIYALFLCQSSASRGSLLLHSPLALFSAWKKEVVAFRFQRGWPHISAPSLLSSLVSSHHCGFEAGSL